MTIRNLDSMFKPRAVALIGASRTPQSVGAVLARNLFKSGFDGPVMPVNPKHRAIEGVLTYPDVESLPVTPDLAVISTPPETVPGIIADLGRLGTRAAVVISAGFGDTGSEEGRALQQQVLDAARPHLLRVIGPNCLGLVVPGSGLNASFAHLLPQTGRVAFLAQSGAIVTSVLDWAGTRGVGFSHLVSLGNMADVDLGDMLDYLANDNRTRSILLYIEAVTGARKFVSAARAAARTKPVIVVKAGRHAEGARAAASHTGALAGVDAVYDAVFRRTGVLRVLDLDELFDAAEILAMARPPAGERLTILSNGGGIGVLATDALMDAGGRLAEPGEETLRRLDAVLPRTWSRANPVDIIGDAPASRYADAMEVLLEDPGSDALLVLNCPTAITSATEAAEAVIGKHDRKRGKLLLTSWVGEHTAREARDMFAANGIPCYETPSQAVRAFMYMVNYRRSQDMLAQTPPSIPEMFEPDVEAARKVIERALSREREWLSEPEAKDVLSAYGIPNAPCFTAATAEEAAEVAARIGEPVALKILSPDITHKSDVRGVILNLDTPEMVREAATVMLKRVGERRPEARIEGFIVEAMVRRSGSFELIAGVMEDAQFGPVILFGHGGTGVEVMDDKALGLPPLNMSLAREQMSRTRVYRLLQGYRDREPADLDGIALTLLRISQLVIDIPEVSELDINPLLADSEGVLALDARIRVAGAPEGGTARLAIRPYPKELEETIPLGDGRELWLRPILPEDEPALRAGFEKLTPEEIRFRFFVPMKTMSHVMAARFTQIDYDREMALILTDPGIPGHTEIYGVVRITTDPDNERAEYAIIVRKDMTGMGLGPLLMRRIIDYCRRRGTGEIYGDVLRENTTMLKLCDVLGFKQSSVPGETGIVRVTLSLA